MSLDATKFLATVLEQEIEAKQKALDITTMVTDWSAMIEGDEATVRIPSITPGDVASMPIADAAFAATESDTTIALNLDQDYGKPIIVDVSTQAETPVPLLQNYSRIAVGAHRKNRNKKLLAQIADAADAANQHYKYADTTDDVISAADILAAASVLDNAEAPDEGRYMAVRASDHQYLFDIDNFISRDKMGQNGEAIPTNVIGQVHGFTVVKVPDGQMPYINASTGAAATSGQTAVLFWQSFAVGYGRQIYKMVGPELKAGQDAEWWNLHNKFGKCTQVSTFAVSYRKNA